MKYKLSIFKEGRWLSSSPLSLGSVMALRELFIRNRRMKKLELIPFKIEKV